MSSYNLIRFFKYAFIIGVLLLYIPLCVYTDINWMIKIVLFIPFSLLFLFLSKYLLPNEYDTECVVTGKYRGDDKIGDEAFNISTTLRGHFGVHSKKHSANQGNEIYRAYLCVEFLKLFFFPINCVIVKQGMSIDLIGEGKRRTEYTIYGESKWYPLEVIWLYLESIDIIILFLSIVGLINYAIEYFKDKPK